MREVAAGEPFGIVAELLQRFTKRRAMTRLATAKRSQEETCGEDVAENLPQARSIDTIGIDVRTMPSV